jgi:hypothetical protein
VQKLEHEIDEPELVKGRCYDWQEIRIHIGHEPFGFLTQVGQKIVCACFRKDLNPNAPNVVLPGGSDPQWLEKARLFQQQDTAIPVFVKAECLSWEFVGQFRVEALTEEPKEIQTQKDRYPHLKDIGAVMFLSEG